MRTLVRVVLFSAFLITAQAQQTPEPSGKPADQNLSCDASRFLGRYLTLDELKAKFGDKLAPQKIDVGEGFQEDGALLFPNDADSQLEIYWQHAPEERMLVRVRAPSKWHYGNIRLGSHLKSVERINGKPFDISGWGWDYGGSVISWRDGELATGTLCLVRARFSLSTDKGLRHQRDIRQVMGDKKFSSGHPAMQRLNPQVNEITLILVK
jgi:hypothetical protein